MKRLRVVGVSIAAVSIALLLAVGPASAAVIGHEHYSGEDSFSYFCGDVEVEVEVEFSGTAHLRVGTGKDKGAFFLHDNYRYREVHTAPDGDVLIISGNGLFQETRATRVNGTIFLFTSVNAGQVFTVTDEDGRVLLRDRGRIRETILFDTLGDNVPGGTFIASVDFSVAGPHPSLLFSTCSLLG
jgi:hypothetical protein